MDPPSSTQMTTLSPDAYGGEEDHCNHDEADNVLQKYVAFFDRNKDGLVYPWETFQGFHAIGCGWALSGISALFINLALSHKTRPACECHNWRLENLFFPSSFPFNELGKCMSLLYPIEVKNIQRSKHGSDSGVCDDQGRFAPGKFEEIFKRHAKTHADSLTRDELDSMLNSHRQ